MSPSWTFSRNGRRCDYGSKKDKELEKQVTKEARSMLKLLHVPFFKHYSTMGSYPGVSDIIGSVPGTPRPAGDLGIAIRILLKELLGRDPHDLGEAVTALAGEIFRLRERGQGFFCELKAPGKTPRTDQEAFLAMMRAGGALCFDADNSMTIVRELAAAGYEPAKRIREQFPGQGGA